MINKAELKKTFTKDWKKHYKVQFLIDKGFKRKQCKTCGSWFWALDESRDVCADTSCVGYQFIGKGTKHFSYVETWKEIEKYFKKSGHTSIKRYPTVCRWRDDLYFTNASIIDFQPYVVTGEVEPPANPLIVPQTSLRFKDVSNVGVTGAHYTCFVMFGQHAFNTKKTKQFYWKDEALEHDYNYLLKVIGVKKEDLVFKEDVWAGGGTFGPCIEYFAEGVELGNCVFMQFQDLGNGKYTELKNKVVDMGAGLERLAWYTNGTATSYDVTYGDVIKKMFKNADLKIDKKLFLEYSKLAGKLNIDEVKNIHAEKEKIAKQLGVSYDELYKGVEKIQALYSVADHLKTILYTTTDGMLPSNSGGGYNLRMLLRRVFAFDSELKLNLDYDDIIRRHAELLAPLDDTVLEGVTTSVALVNEEEKKFKQMKETAGKKLSVVIENAKKGKEISQDDLVKFYESEGIPPETVQELAKKSGVEVSIPDDFYGMIAKKDERTKKKISYGLEKYPNTQMLFHKDPYINEFTAKVLGIEGNALILDKTLFYPESGGQASDFGSIDGIQVYDVQKEGGIVLHFVKKIENFKRNQNVYGEIDAQRRLALMRHHTATHLLNASARELLGKHIWQGGAEKQHNKAHLDITHFKKINEKEIKELEILVNEKILANIPITTELLSRDKAESKYGFRIYQGGFVPGKELRIINVKGIDVQACGGTHVTNTGQIGFFKIIKRESVKDGVERITFVAGMPALQYVQTREELISKSSEIMSVPEQMLVESTNRFFNEWKEQRKRIEELQARLGQKTVENANVSKDGHINQILPSSDPNELLKMAQQITNTNKKAIAVLCDANGNLVILRGSECKKSAKEIFGKIVSQCKGAGGGNDKIARGRIKDIEKFKKLIK
ncbi:MAG: alanine--tRNA ligase [Candidatus Diapherotrites archaeon]